MVYQGLESNQYDWLNILDFFFQYSGSTSGTDFLAVEPIQWHLQYLKNHLPQINGEMIWSG